MTAVPRMTTPLHPRTVCEQRLDLWAVYQRAAAEQFSTLTGLYDQLEAVVVTQAVTPRSGQGSPLALGGHARLAVRYTTCKQVRFLGSSCCVCVFLAYSVSCLQEFSIMHKSHFMNFALFAAKYSSNSIAFSPST